MQKYIVLKSSCLSHESRYKEERIVMTMRDLMTEFGSLLMFNYTPQNVTIDGGTFYENKHPDDRTSPLKIKFEVLEEFIGIT